MSAETRGKIEKKIVNGETEVEWEISNFLSIIESSFCFFHYKSPTFTFANDSCWNLELYQENLLSADYVAFDLRCNLKREFSMEYTFGVKKRDGTVDHLLRGELYKSEVVSDQWNLIPLSELLLQKSELVPFGNITFTCRLKPYNISLLPSTVLNAPKVEKFISLDTLSENFKDLFFNKESCDVTLYVMDKVYKAHRSVLMARSSVFAAMFLHESSEKQTGIVKISDCEPECFFEFLKFLYCGKLEELSFCKMMPLYEISDKYDVQDLKTFCKKSLMENLAVENVCDITIIADKHDDTELLAAAQDFFNENIKQIFETSEWDSLVKNNYSLSKKLLKEMSSKVKVIH